MEQIKDFDQEKYEAVKASRIEFAKKMAKNGVIISNPNDTSSGSSEVLSRALRSQIISYIQNPAANEKSLRSASNYMSLTSPHYSRLLWYFANIPLFAYVISPVAFHGFENDKDKEAFAKNYYKTCDLVERMRIPSAMSTMFFTMFKDGAYYGVRWTTKEGTTFQKLNHDICKFTSQVGDRFGFSIDTSKLKEQNLPSFPPQIETIWREAKTSGLKWQEVPDEISVAMKADPSATFTVPPFSSVMPQMYRIGDAEANTDAADALEVYKMIYLKMPTGTDGVPKMEFDEYKRYFDHISANLGSDVSLAGSPMEATAITFDKSGSAEKTNKVLNAVENCLASIGVSPQLFGINSNTGASLKHSITADESYVFSFLGQAESLVNNILDFELSGKFKFKINFLRASMFNVGDLIKTTKEAASFGLGKSQYAALLNIPQYDIAGLNYIENEVINIDSILTPLKNSYTGSGESSSGRPEAEETNLQESGEISRDSGANENRA